MSARLGTGHRPSGRDHLDQVVAALVLLVVLVGLPAALVAAVGWPLPGVVPGGDDVGSWVTQPLSSLAVVKVLATITWLLWAHFAGCVVVEVVHATPQLRAGRAHPRGRDRGRVSGWTGDRVRVPLGGPSQVLARSLVAAVLLVGVSGPILAASPPASAYAAVLDLDTPPAPSPVQQIHQGEQVQHIQQGMHPDPGPAADRTGSQPAADTATRVGPADPVPIDPVPSDAVSGEEVRRYVVSAPQVGSYDNLWDIAAEHLGDGMRWSQIYALNTGLTQPDGGALTDPDLIRPGWQLRMPADAVHLPAWSAAAAQPETPPPAEAFEHVVQPGDTLWDIAQTDLGDGTRYPELAAAAAGIVQADGDRLVDPDLIRPGWVIPVLTTGSAQVDAPVSGAPPAPEIPEVPELPSDRSSGGDRIRHRRGPSAGASPGPGPGRRGCARRARLRAPPGRTRRRRWTRFRQRLRHRFQRHRRRSRR